MVLPLDFFPKRTGEKRQAHCKECARAYVKSHYQTNKKYYANRNKERRNKIQEKILEILSQSHCMVCGENELILLDFDHRDPTTKLFNVSHAPKKLCSMKKLMEEIKKCDVLCVVCHRRKTAKQENWKRFQYNF